MLVLNGVVTSGWRMEHRNQVPVWAVGVIAQLVELAVRDWSAWVTSIINHVNHRHVDSATLTKLPLSVALARNDINEAATT